MMTGLEDKTRFAHPSVIARMELALIGGFVLLGYVGMMRTLVA